MKFEMEKSIRHKHQQDFFSFFCFFSVRGSIRRASRNICVKCYVDEAGSL